MTDYINTKLDIIIEKCLELNTLRFNEKIKISKDKEELKELKLKLKKAESYKEKNKKLKIAMKNLKLGYYKPKLIDSKNDKIEIDKELFNYILLFGWQAGLKDYNELDLDEKEEKYLIEITKYVHSL